MKHLTIALVLLCGLAMGCEDGDIEATNTRQQDEFNDWLEREAIEVHDGYFVLPIRHKGCDGALIIVREWYRAFDLSHKQFEWLPVQTDECNALPDTIPSFDR